MNIVAFDPGYTTGIALYDSDVHRYEIEEATGLPALWELINMGGQYDHIVYESFLYQRRDKVDLRPVESIGVIKLYCYLNNKTPRSQTPAQGKRFWTDDKIKKLDLWQPGKPHGMDALRHLLYFQAFGLKMTILLDWLKDD